MNSAEPPLSKSHKATTQPYVNPKPYTNVQICPCGSACSGNRVQEREECLFWVLYPLGFGIRLTSGRRNPNTLPKYRAPTPKPYVNPKPYTNPKPKPTKDPANLASIFAGSLRACQGGLRGRGYDLEAEGLLTRAGALGFRV